eukprot:1116006-Pelagomonas_calceolata.AAC.1
MLNRPCSTCANLELEGRAFPTPYSFLQSQSPLWHNRQWGADACARTAALTDTTNIALPDAKDPFYSFYRLSLKTSHAQNDGMHRSHAFPIH